MIQQEDIRHHLEKIAEQRPESVRDRLSKGDKVSKSSGLQYEIDDVEIDKRLGEFPQGCVPYGPIHRKLRSSREKIREIFGNSAVAPFSRAFESGVGECLEKAVLVQLAAQKEGNAFLISGSLDMDNEFGEHHAYNVIFNNGVPYLVDAQNPLGKDSNGNITHPYIAPITGIEGDCFQVSSEWRQGRTYSL